MATAVLTMFTFGIPHALAAPTVANDDSATTMVDTAVTVVVFANDTDADGDQLFMSQYTHPTNGTVKWNPGYTVTYTPNARFVGTDSFTYNVWDGTSASNYATVTITVTSDNDAPVAVTDTAETTEDTAVTVEVLANDTDADGDTLTIATTTNPTDGTVTVNGDSTITYTPSADYHGTDSFSYTVSDGTTDSTAATVTIAVAAVNDDPIARDDAFTIDEDTQLVGNVTVDNGSGADSDIEDTLTPDALVVQNVAKGSLHLSTDGSFTYTPNANYYGTDSFTYTVSDGTATSNIATVTITVTAVYDDPPPADPPPADPPPADPDLSFDDLEAYSDETVAAVETLVDLGIITGTNDTSFSPELITERWQMAVFLTRVLAATGTVLPPGGSGFSDLTHYGAETQTAMNQLAGLGISTGTSAGEFSPAGKVTRSQMALFVVRTLEAGGVALPAAGGSTFTDLAGSPAEVRDAVGVLSALGITNGTAGSAFSPDAELPRWQMALFLARVMEAIEAD